MDRGPILLLGKSREELESLAEGWGEPSFRGRQLYHWIYARRMADPLQMTNLSRSFRDRLAQGCRIDLPRVDATQRSTDGTVKMALRLADGALIECVYIPEETRDTLCISSQAGCAVGCTFCATATMGLHRNLTAGEIVGQAFLALASGVIRRPAFNIVMMGMGEPLHNFEPVMHAVRLLSDPTGMAVPLRKITLSTSGVVSGLERLAREPAIPNLAISLNATTDDLRTSLMPINRKWNIQALLEACRQFPLESRRRITFEYVLLGGMNDSDEQARQLVNLLHGMRAKVNLIAWNRNPSLPFRAPTPDRVDRFRRILEAAGVSAFLRKPRGADIAAACGQLAIQRTDEPFFKELTHEDP